MARNDDGDGVAMDGLSDGLCRATADAFGDSPVCSSLSVWDDQQLTPDFLLKRSALRLDERGEIRYCPVKIKVKPTEGIRKDLVLLVIG